MKILIVEDDPVSQKLLAGIVSSVSTNFVTADNGEAAFETFCDAVESDDPFDLIFLDVMMPLASGQEALAAIREYEVQSGVPLADGVKVVMTTALSDGTNIYEAHANGCVDYLVKPLGKDRVLRAVQRLGLPIETGD